MERFSLIQVSQFSTTSDVSNRDFAKGSTEQNLAPQWVTGISDSEGNFSIFSQKTNKGNKFILAYKVTQKEHSFYTAGLIRLSNHIYGHNSIISKRCIYTCSGDNPNKLKPVAYYSNADTLKKEILKENKGKSGVYCWRNLENNKTYVGSSTDLYIRFRQYFNVKLISMGKDSNMVICKALFKYGYSAFSLEILEYCDKDEVLSREQYYLDFLKPEYNVLKTAGSPAGYKHTNSAREKMRGKRVYSVKHISMLREQALINNAAKRLKVEVYDTEKNVTTSYDSLTEAAKALNCYVNSLVSHEKTKAKYLIKKGEIKLFQKRYNVTIFRGV